MGDQNGQAHGPPFAVFSPAGFIVYSRNQVLEWLAATRATNLPTNLKIGPIFDDAMEFFRNWSTLAEPGMLARFQELRIVMIRLASFVEPAQFVGSARKANLPDQPTEPPLHVARE